MRPRYALPALLAVVTLALAPALGAASPMPVPVCQPCSAGFEQAAMTQDNVPERIVDAEVTVSESTATVEVAENGTATWTVRLRLAEDAAVTFFRENPDALRRVADDAWLVGDADLLSSRVQDDGTIVLRYRVREFATRSSGVLRVDYFREEPGRYAFYELGADRLTLVGPPDTRVTSGMPGATVDGNRLTATEYRGRGDGPFVVFAPADDPLAGANTHAAIADATGGVVLRNLLLLVLVPGLVLAAGTWTAGAVVGRRWLAAGRERARRLGGVVAAAGLVFALYAALPGHQSFVGTYAPWGVVGGVAAAVCGGAVAARPDAWPLRRLVGLVAGATVLGTLAAAVGAAVLGTGDLGWRLTWAALPVTATLWLLVVGRGRSLEGRARTLVLAVPPVGFALAVVATTPLTAGGGPMFLLQPVIYVGYALVAIAAGLPLLALGATIPGVDGEDDPPRPPRSGHALE